MQTARSTTEDRQQRARLGSIARAVTPERRLSRAMRHGVAVAIVVLLGTLASWTHHAIRSSLAELRAASLASTLEAEVKALDVWISEKKLTVRRLARDERVRARVERLVRAAAACASAEADALRAEVAPLLREETFAAFVLVDRAGAPLAALPASSCATADPARIAREVAPALSGETQFIAPRRNDAFAVPPRGTETAPPAVWFETAVEDASGRAIAVVALGRYADGGFGSILATARSGRSAEVFAFDAQGALLSESRFTEDLVRRGLIAPSAKPTALLAASLRLPPTAGGDPASAPLTRLAEEALAGPATAPRRGVLMEPYPSYRGVDVVGAWRWLPEYRMGVAVEVEAEEAYAPLAFLNSAFGIVFGVLVAAMTGALMYALWLRRQMEAPRFGAYVLERKLGEGGMADVYLARHALLRRPTAVKILRAEHATDQLVTRFEREVKLASQLAHPNTVEIYDYGRTPGGQFFYAMEYLDGIELFDLVKAGEVPIGRATYLLRQVCAGLAEAHAKGLVHRDIKPENIMVCVHGGEADVVKILDFGLVKNIAEPHTRDLTRALKLLGTPPYMAPERFRSPADVDARADIYSIGAVAFFVLTGREVFEGADDMEIANRILNEEAARPSSVTKRAIPVELDLLVTACLEKRREDRPQRVTDLAEALEALSATHRWTRRDAEQWWHDYRAAHPAP